MSDGMGVNIGIGCISDLNHERCVEMFYHGDMDEGEAREVIAHLMNVFEISARDFGD